MEETVYKRSGKGRKIGEEKDDHLRLRTDTSSIRLNRTIVIGRDKSCNFQIDDPLVSRKHAIIEFISSYPYIRDAGSTNATYVNNNPLKPGEKKRLRRGDVIRMGKTEISIA